LFERLLLPFAGAEGAISHLVSAVFINETDDRAASTEAKR
jgi:hypothetical protein